MTNSSHNGCGIDIMMNAKVELMNVTVKGCGNSALRTFDLFSETTFVATRCEFANNRYGAYVYGSLSSATFKNCVFHDNTHDGIHVGSATIHLHGKATAIYSNGRYGICAYSSGKVLIHLPSDHNTSYNNGQDGIAASSAKVVIHLPSHHNTTYNNTRQDRLTMSGGTITNVED